MSTPLITFYHYAFSPYARRIQWYLALRGLPFTECVSICLALSLSLTIYEHTLTAG